LAQRDIFSEKTFHPNRNEISDLWDEAQLMLAASQNSLSEKGYERRNISRNAQKTPVD
jgi:hypothetical protein